MLLQNKKRGYFECQTKVEWVGYVRLIETILKAMIKYKWLGQVRLKEAIQKTKLKRNCKFDSKIDFADVTPKQEKRGYFECQTKVE